MEKLNVKTFYKPDENIVKKMKETFYGCQTAVNYCRSLKIPEELYDDNIDILYDFARDINYCKKCPGIENCIKDNQLLVTKVVYDDGIVERQLVPCKKLLAKMQIKNQFLVKDFDESFFNEQPKPKNSLGSNAAVLFFNSYLQNKSFDNWLYLYGENEDDNLKTAAYMAIAAAKKKKESIAFINCPFRFRQLYDLSKKSEEEFQNILEAYCSSEFLILFDFGNEYKNDFIRDVILYKLLVERKNRHLFTLFVSNYTINDAVAQYSSSKAGDIKVRQINKLIKSKVGDEGEINLDEDEID